MPFSARHLRRFETEYCYDRYFESTNREGWCTRIMCCGHALRDDWGCAFRIASRDAERGLLGQFRQSTSCAWSSGALRTRPQVLMMSDRLVSAIKRLRHQRGGISSPVRRDIRQTLEIFLRFTHRYWYHEMLRSGPIRDVFHMLTRHLGSEKAYREVRDELHDMGEYLDSDLLRRQSNTMVRLTVITIAGLIGMTTTGFFGMNLLAWADAPLRDRAILLFSSVGPDNRADRLYRRQVTAPGRISGRPV